MVARDTYLEHLASVPLFAACSRRDLQRIAKASDEVQIPEGRTLVKQGDIARECFVLVDGKVKVERNGRRVATLGPGAAFGELSLLDKGPRTATVTAETLVTVLVLGSREFSAVLDEVPTLTHKLMTALAQQIRELDEKTYG
jgi:CRP-like cAMP-binding protein